MELKGKHGVYTLSSDLLGQGTFGKVYSGTNAKQEGVAIKKLHSLVGGESSNLLELFVLSELQHPNILYAIDFIFTLSYTYIILPKMYIDLASYISSQDQPIPKNLQESYANQLLSGLSCLHENRIIHSDFKTSNILIDEAGGLKIADFGISIIGTNFRGHQPCTLYYLSPENLLLFDNTSYSSDMWAAGLVIIEMEIMHPLFQLKLLTEFKLYKKMLKYLGPFDKDLKLHCKNKDLLSNCDEIEAHSPNRKNIKDIYWGTKKKLRKIVEGCIKWAPSDRLTAKQALAILTKK